MLFYKLLFWISALFLLNDSFSSEYAGTEARLESEYKITIKDTKKNLVKVLEKSLFSLVEKNTLKSDSLTKTQYFLSGKNDPYVFVDIYFDTKDLDLYRQNSIYRLRYRWKSLLQFQGFRSQPEVKDFPIRCEVQAKTKIQAKTENLFEAKESRFEFRDESAPFSKENPAPKSPWPLKDFLNYAKTGQYKKYHMLPFKEIGLKKGISPRYVVKTNRTRFHLNLPSKWGNGPNPMQAFIVTLDHFQYKKFDTVLRTFISEFKGDFFEIEIELERNISTNLEIEKEGDAQKLYSTLKGDQKVIRDQILSELKLLDIKVAEKSQSKITRVLKADHEID